MNEITEITKCIIFAILSGGLSGYMGSLVGLWIQKKLGWIKQEK